MEERNGREEEESVEGREGEVYEEVRVASGVGGKVEEEERRARRRQ